ncbi:hypothetical protein HPB51_000689 [Rhipicephalus microplus]|uniref:RRM domain-containing protein n=1 Tax=Rhipicephalus microplus TaxID=6941 RepID=A0A9J6E571_RHIMP|nr:hypothetical protein HPB51_000689 [Rhipicephalus microplus]
MALIGEFGTAGVVRCRMAQSNHNHRMQHAHQQHHPSSHHSRSEFVSLPYFQQQQQQYMMPAENGCHYHMTEVGRPGEEEEDSLSTPKKRGRKKKIKVEDQDLPLSLEASFPVIRKRGRPRKYPIPDGEVHELSECMNVAADKHTASEVSEKSVHLATSRPNQKLRKTSLAFLLSPHSNPTHGIVSRFHGETTREIMTRVYVGHLSYHVQERDLERFFRGFEKIREDLLKNGFGFAELDDYRDADDAVYELKGRELDGERVVVELAHTDDDTYRWGNYTNDDDTST